MSAMANTTPIMTTVTKSATNPRDADATPRVNIQDLCKEYYEDILPIIMDKVRRDKRKEVHAMLDFGEGSRETRTREGSHYSCARTLSARTERLKVRDRLRYNDWHVLDRLGHRRQSAFDRLSKTYSPSTTKSRPDRTSSRDRSRGRSRPHRRDSPNGDSPESKDCFRGVRESYGNSHSSYETGINHGYRYHDRDRSRHTKRGRDSESPLSHVSKSDSSDGGHWKSKSKGHKPTDEDDLTMPWMCEEVDPFTPKFVISKAAAQVKRWAMPTWCHMFNSTLIGAARVWFDELYPESIDGYKDLKAAFLAYFIQQKKYVKDPVEIHNIKEKDGETIEDFMERFKVETGRMKGAPECMRISGFMHGVNNPELTKRLDKHVPKTMKEVMITTTAFIRGEAAAASKKKGHTSWRAHDQSKRQTLEKRTPKEILAAEAGKFRPLPPMVTLVEKRSNNKFCDFHNDKGYSTDECMQLKKQIEELVRAGKLSHLIKEIKQGRDQSKVGKKAPAKDKPTAIYMIQSWQRMTRQKVTQSFERVREITFPSLATSSGTEGPLIIEAEIGGHMIHRMYMDGGSSTEVLYEHYFNQLQPKVKNQMVPATTSLTGFSGETIWPLGQLRLLRSIAQGMLKFPADGGIVTIRSTILTPAECTMVTASSKEIPKEAVVCHENFKVALHLNFPDQEVAIGGTLSAKGRIKLCLLPKENLDIFAWQPSDMTGVPQSVAEHRLNIREGYSPVRQTKRGQASECAKAIQVEDCYPLPEIDWKVESLCGYPFKCFLDAYKGYHQIQLVESDEEKTAFHTGQGVYCYTKMHFDLKNAGATYQRLVDKAFDNQIAPKPKKELIVYMSASYGAISAALMTERGMVQMPVYFVSRALQGPKLNYTSMEKLVLSLVLAAKRLRRTITKWSVMLGEHNITYRLRTSVKGQSCVDGSGAGLILTSPEGTEFTYALRFQFAASNNKAEGIRRQRRKHDQIPREGQKPALRTYLGHGRNTQRKIHTREGGDNRGTGRWTNVDDTNNRIFKKRTLPSNRKEARKLRIKARQYKLLEGVLYRRSFLTPWLRCVGPLQADYVIREIHEGSCIMHAGPRSVVAKAIRLGYYWPTMHRDARDMIRTCNDCQIHRPMTRRPHQPLTPITAPWPFYKWGIDIAGPFPEGPGEGIKARLGERNKNWVEELPHVLWAHRTMIKSSHGDTSFSLTYGTEAVIPTEIGMPTYRTAVVDVIHNDEELRLNLDFLEERHERVAIREAKAKLKMTKYYNTRVCGVTFRPGDFVYRSNDASHAVDGGKLRPRWEGPYEVTKALGDGAYKLRSANKTVLPRTWNVANLKKYYL
uniref:Reverse transcriptase domain-containing protein n=1 Tax=Tanacetum cinerariifolium TaxID=118510 RepID=A0A6L2JR06_TANCI|nr:reverse transcriptase domain-containing protein [Tanacetum cinerariifolium]